MIVFTAVKNCSILQRRVIVIELDVRPETQAGITRVVNMGAGGILFQRHTRELSRSLQRIKTHTLNFIDKFEAF